MNQFYLMLANYDCLCVNLPDAPASSHALHGDPVEQVRASIGDLKPTLSPAQRLHEHRMKMLLSVALYQGMDEQGCREWAEQALRQLETRLKEAKRLAAIAPPGHGPENSKAGRRFGLSQRVQPRISHANTRCPAEHREG